MKKPDGKARLVGINHVALEVDDLERALDFYAALFDFELRGRSEKMAFLDMGDQFLALAEGRTQKADEHRHFGLVVDSREGMRAQLEKLGAEILPSRGLDFLDPWGNHIQVVVYEDIQFTKAANVLCGMNLEHLGKTSQAQRELADKGMSFDKTESR
ncbi:MAG: VOC family protein [Syntrophotaleaceae bacterium]